MGKNEQRFLIARIHRRRPRQRVPKGRRELSCGLLWRNARLQAAEHVQCQPVGRSIERVIGWRCSPGIECGTVLQRDPEVHSRMNGIYAIKTAWRDADDSQRNSFDVDNLAQNALVAAKAALPPRIIQNGNGGVRGFVSRVNPRPRTGCTPRPEKKLPLTISPNTSSGSLPTRTATFSKASGAKPMTSWRTSWRVRMASNTGMDMDISPKPVCEVLSG